MPVSVTLSSTAVTIAGCSTSSETGWAATVMVPFSGVYLTALSSKLDRTCINRSSSPSTAGRFSFTKETSRCPFLSAKGLIMASVRSMTLWI